VTGRPDPRPSASPPGEYEIVARYIAREEGVWHGPVFSEPLRIRIVPGEPPCRKASATESLAKP
jgi:hypothetical protein